ncbi:unnamed protein product [Schistosoma intercalatum]|nr:unnamed protein product [Schistosoma intercalatum]
MNRLLNHLQIEIQMDFFNLVQTFLFLLYISKQCTSVCKLSNDYKYYHSNIQESKIKRNVFIKQLKVIPYYTETIRQHAHFEIIRGFNSEAFRYMRDERGEPRTMREPATNEPILTDSLGYRIPDESVLSNVTRIWKSAKTTVYRHLTALKTPMMLNELMTPLLSSRSYISKITLGFFEDTGWYRVDYSKANPMGYGKHLGCNFVMKSCYEYMQLQRERRQSFYPYCDQISFSNTLCLKHENAYGFCDLKQYYSPLPLEFQYFDDPRLGAADRYRDYCPAYVVK